MRLAPTLLVVLLLAGCASNEDGGDATPITNNSTTDAPAAPPAVAIAVALHNEPGLGVPPMTMGIDPSTIELSLNVPVNLTVTNSGSGAHNLVIEGLDVATDNIDPGASVSVLFTPTEEGTFAMYCSIGGDAPVGHRGQGMVGEVVVS